MPTIVRPLIVWGVMSQEGRDQTGTRVIPISKGGTPWPMLLTLSPHGQLLLVASLRDDTIACWDVASGVELWRVPDDSYSFSLTAVCLPGGRMLVASGGEDG